MDEEQGLVSPIAGGIRGIRRSVSSSVFTGRAVPPPQPDPQTTSLLSQNSLALSNISGQLASISGQVISGTFGAFFFQRCHWDNFLRLGLLKNIQLFR